MAPNTALQLGLALLQQTADRHADSIAALVPLARELAAKAGAQGVTVSDLRLYAVQRGLLTGQEKGRQLSYLGAVMRAAELRNTGEYRRSTVERSNGNLHAVWVAE